MPEVVSTTVVHPPEIRSDNWQHALLLLLINLGYSLAIDTLTNGSQVARLVPTVSVPNAPQQPTHLEV